MTMITIIRMIAMIARIAMFIGSIIRIRRVFIKDA
jgi:hypothetical protein